MIPYIIIVAIAMEIIRFNIHILFLIDVENNSGVCDSLLAWIDIVFFTSPWINSTSVKCTSTIIFRLIECKFGKIDVRD